MVKVAVEVSTVQQSAVVLMYKWIPTVVSEYENTSCTYRCSIPKALVHRDKNVAKD